MGGALTRGHICCFDLTLNEENIIVLYLLLEFILVFVNDFQFIQLIRQYLTILSFSLSHDKNSIFSFNLLIKMMHIKKNIFILFYTNLLISGYFYLSIFRLNPEFIHINYLLLKNKETF